MRSTGYLLVVLRLVTCYQLRIAIRGCDGFLGDATAEWSTGASVVARLRALVVEFPFAFGKREGHAIRLGTRSGDIPERLKDPLFSRVGDVEISSRQDTSPP